jgi:hypothetical protein
MEGIILWKQKLIKEQIRFEMCVFHVYSSSISTTFLRSIKSRQR